MHEYLQEMHREVLSRYDVMTVGETHSVTPPSEAVRLMICNCSNTADVPGQTIRLRPYEARVYVQSEGER